MMFTLLPIPAKAGIRPAAYAAFIKALRADQTPAFAGVVCICVKESLS